MSNQDPSLDRICRDPFPPPPQEGSFTSSRSGCGRVFFRSRSSAHPTRHGVSLTSPAPGERRFVVRRHVDRKWNWRTGQLHCSLPSCLCTPFPLSPNIVTPRFGSHCYGLGPSRFPNSNSQVVEGCWQTWGQLDPVKCLPSQSLGVSRRQVAGDVVSRAT